jgi:hypothetical protein
MIAIAVVGICLSCRYACERRKAQRRREQDGPHTLTPSLVFTNGAHPAAQRGENKGRFDARHIVVSHPQPSRVTKFLLVIGMLTPGFHRLRDFISTLT